MSAAVANIQDPLALAPNAPVPQKAVALITDALRQGLSLRQACDFAGAPYDAVKAWMVPQETDGLPQVEFRRLLRQAMAQVAYSDLCAISAATGSDWKAAAWRLSRMFRRQWAEDLPPAPSTQISVDQSNLTVHGGLATTNSWSAVLHVPAPTSPRLEQRLDPIDAACPVTIDAVPHSSDDADSDPFAC